MFSKFATSAIIAVSASPLKLATTESSFDYESTAPHPWAEPYIYESPAYGPKLLSYLNDPRLTLTPYRPRLSAEGYDPSQPMEGYGPSRSMEDYRPRLPAEG